MKALSSPITPPINEVLISIVIPFYHGEAHINELVQSIYLSFLSFNQISGSVEIIIVIDSEDTNLDNLRDQIDCNISYDPNIEILYIKNQINIGVARSRNVGYKKAKGEFIIFIDQDDELEVDFFPRIFPFLKDYDFLLVNGVFYNVRKNIRFKIFYLQPKITLKQLILQSFIRSPGQVILRKSMIPKNGFPSPVKYFGADDKFFWISVFIENKALRKKYIGRCLYVANLHDKNYSNNYKELSHSCLELWEGFKGNVCDSMLKKWIKRDIMINKFVVGDFDTTKHRLSCGWWYLLYNLDANKIVRYSVKKLKYLKH